MENLKDGLWTSAGRQAAIAEAILQIIGVYYMGRTVHFGAIHGYFMVHHTEFQDGANLLVMIIGALFFVVYLPFGAGALIVHGFGFYYRFPAKKPRRKDAALVSVGGVGWIGSWLFITGYVRLAGDL